MSTKVRGVRATKEAFFVQVKTDDDRAVFFDATNHLGRTNPFANPLATCALRVTDAVLAFSLLRLTKNNKAALAERPLAMPHKPLAKAESLGESLAGMDLNTLVMVIGADRYEFTLSRDDNAVVTLELRGDVPDQIELTAMNLNLLLASPRGPRIVAVGFLGHLGKPGAPDTLTRVASMALNYLTALPAFRLAAGVETVSIPTAPSRWAVARPVRKASDEVVVAVPVRLWSVDSEPVASGVVQIQVDLDTANPHTGHMLYHFRPDADLAEHFEPFRAIAESAVAATMGTQLGVAEMTDLVYSITLDELSEGDLGRIRDAASALTAGVDLSPLQWALFPAV